MLYLATGRNTWIFLFLRFCILVFFYFVCTLMYDSIFNKYRVAYPEVVYVWTTVNTVFINKHCCSSVLMLRPTVWNSLPHLYSVQYALLSASLLFGRTWRVKTYVRKKFEAGSLCAALIYLTKSFVRYKFVTYTYLEHNVSIKIYTRGYNQRTDLLYKEKNYESILLRNENEDTESQILHLH